MPGLPPLEYKVAPTEIKAITAGSSPDGTYEGYFSVFGNVDDGGDVMEQGAFTKSLQERGPGAAGGNRIKVVYFHRSGLDGQLPILVGAPPEILSQDSKGLYGKGQLVLGVQAARETWELIKAGAITEASIGYIAEPARIRRENGIRYIGAAKLFELSFVPLGMNPATRITAAKALQMSMAGGMPDDPFELLGLLNTLLQYVCQGNSLAQTEPDDLQAAAGYLDQAQAMITGLLAAATPAGAELNAAPDLSLAALRLLPELKAGRMLSAASLTKIRAAHAALQALLDAAAPDEAKAAYHPAPPVDAHRRRLLAIDTRLALLRAGGLS